MICPKCGKEIPEGSRYCNSCGYKIEPIKKPSILEYNSNKIDKQGTLKDDSKKTKENNSVDDKKYKKQRRNLVIQLLVIFVVVIGGIIGYSYYNAKKPINVTMDAAPVTDGTGTKFDITTNLPDGTNLMVTLTGSTNSYNGQDSSSTVKDGKIETVDFSDSNLQLPNGKYTIEITTPSNLNSKGSSFGDISKKLSGKYIVYDASAGCNTLDFKKDITITGSTNDSSDLNDSSTTNTESDSSKVPTIESPVVSNSLVQIIIGDVNNISVYDTLDVTIVNNTNSIIYIIPSNFTLVGNNGESHSLEYDRTTLNATTLQPGEKTSGYIEFVGFDKGESVTLDYNDNDYPQKIPFTLPSK